MKYKEETKEIWKYDEEDRILSLKTTEIEDGSLKDEGEFIYKYIEKSNGELEEELYDDGKLEYI